MRNGKISTTDGPWVETKEQLGGYFLIEARDLNEAIRVAAGIPGAARGCVEVRPVADDATDAGNPCRRGTVMKYLCLVYLDEKRLDELPDEDCVEFDTAIRNSGHCIASEALESVQTATTVRVRDGKVSITDGPFAETKEQLAGFYMIEARTSTRRSRSPRKSRRRAWAASKCGRSGRSGKRSPRRKRGGARRTRQVH